MRDKLIKILEQKFGKDKFSIGSGDEPAITFLAAHPAVGDLQIWDDGCEAIVGIGEITHGHFSCFQENITQDEIEQEVAESVADFVEDMLADKFRLWRSKSGGAGGWQWIDSASESNPMSDFEKDADYFLWSGPIPLK